MAGAGRRNEMEASEKGGSRPGWEWHQWWNSYQYAVIGINDTNAGMIKGIPFLVLIHSPMFVPKKENKCVFLLEGDLRDCSPCRMQHTLGWCNCIGGMGDLIGFG